MIYRILQAKKRKKKRDQALLWGKKGRKVETVQGGEKRSSPSTEKKKEGREKKSFLLPIGREKKGRGNAKEKKWRHAVAIAVEGKRGGEGREKAFVITVNDEGEEKKGKGHEKKGGNFVESIDAREGGEEGGKCRSGQRGGRRGEIVPGGKKKKIANASRGSTLSSRAKAIKKGGRGGKGRQRLSRDYRKKKREEKKEKKENKSLKKKKGRGVNSRYSLRL